MSSFSFSSFILPLLLLTFSLMTSDTSVAEARNLPQSALPSPKKVHGLSKLELPPLPLVPKIDVPLPPLPSVPIPGVPIPNVPIPEIPKPELPAVTNPQVPEIPKANPTTTP